MDDHDTRLARRLGAAIARARKALGWTLEEASEAIGTSKNHLQFMETARRLPSAGMLAKLTRTLDLDLNELVADRKAEHKAAGELEALARAVDPALRPLMVDILRAAARHRPAGAGTRSKRRTRPHPKQP